MQSSRAGERAGCLDQFPFTSRSGPMLYPPPRPSAVPALLMGLLLLALVSVPRARAALLREVTTLEDTLDPGDGLVSLREAINASASGDGIAFGVTGIIALQSGELAITRGLEIIGPGARQLTINGRGASRIF